MGMSWKWAFECLVQFIKCDSCPCHDECANNMYRELGCVSKLTKWAKVVGATGKKCNYADGKDVR
jgi:hypothetical protein